MLAETIESWKEDLMQEGIRKGKLEGKRAFARGLILTRFKDADAAKVDALLAQANDSKELTIHHKRRWVRIKNPLPEFHLLAELLASVQFV